MDKIFQIVVASFQSLWKIKNYDSTIEIITPQATINDCFVSVFITKRANDYIVTDGGWIEAGIYDCEPDHTNMIYQRLFNYYLVNNKILVTEAKGKKYYYKKISDEVFVPNLVFDMSQFIASVVNAVFVPFVPQKEQNTFKRRAKLYLNREFGEENIEYDRTLTPELHVKFSAIKRDSDGTNLINFISGSNPSTYANCLCRSNMGFQMVEEKQSMLGIKKKVTLIDDSNESLLRTTLVKPYLDYLQGRANSTDVLLRWSQHEHLREIV